jgi:hypothetical protein
MKNALLVLGILLSTLTFSQETTKSFIERSNQSEVVETTKDELVFMSGGYCDFSFNGETITISTDIYRPFVTEDSFVEEFEGNTENGEKVVMTAFYKDKRYKKLQHLIIAKANSEVYLSVVK